jgi:macrodomain Ter protein organizer (MatP/YcbG family)
MTQENKTQKISFLIEPIVHQKILEIARLESRTLSSVVQMAINDKINNYESNKK